MFVVRLSYTLVMYVLFTITVLLTLTRSTYRGLYRRAGTYTSRGPSGNHATPAPPPTVMETLKSGVPTQPTRAGAYTARTARGPGTQHQRFRTCAQRP